MVNSLPLHLSSSSSGCKSRICVVSKPTKTTGQMEATRKGLIDCKNTRFSTFGRPAQISQIRWNEFNKNNCWHPQKNTGPTAQCPSPPKPPDQPPTSNHHTTNSHLGCRSVPRSNIWYEAPPVHAGTGGRTPGTWSSRHHRCILRRAWYVGNLLLKHEETTRMGKWLPFHGKHWRKWRYTWEKHLILGYSAPNSWTNPDGSLVSRLVFILHVEDCGGIC